MKLKNKTKNRTICQIELRESLPGFIFGLMFSFPKNIGFKFKNERRESLHNFFVFYPIDVVLLNKKKKVIEIKHNFRPFTLFTPKNKAQYILELQKGLAKNIAIGDQLSF